MVSHRCLRNCSRAFDISTPKSVAHCWSTKFERDQVPVILFNLGPALLALLVRAFVDSVFIADASAWAVLLRYSSFFLGALHRRGATSIDFARKMSGYSSATHCPALASGLRRKDKEFDHLNWYKLSPERQRVQIGDQEIRRCKPPDPRARKRPRCKRGAGQLSATQRYLTEP